MVKSLQKASKIGLHAGLLLFYELNKKFDGWSRTQHPSLDMALDVTIVYLGHKLEYILWSDFQPRLFINKNSGVLG